MLPLGNAVVGLEPLSGVDPLRMSSSCENLA
jgi:hypothetical protein